MVTLYGIPNCDTVKKTLSWLKNNDLDFIFHNYKTEGVTKEKLKEWCRHFGWQNVLNRNGTTWKKLAPEEQEAISTEKKAISFLAENTSAIKRPIVEYNGKYLIRFNEEEYVDVLIKS